MRIVDADISGTKTEENKMEKNDAIIKINKYGKIGKFISIAMIVIISIVALATLTSAILLKSMPDDLFRIELGTQAEVILNPFAINPDADPNIFETITDYINNGTVKGGLNMGAVSMELHSAEIVGDTVVCKTSSGTAVLLLNNVGNVLLLVTFSTILTLISAIFGARFCMAIEKCESPFEDIVIKRMRFLAFSLIPWALFSSVPGYAVGNMFNNNVKLNFSLDMNIILIVLIILALTVVFKYGAMLQKESDETL